MKRLLNLILASLALFVLVGCQEAEPVAQPDVGSRAPEPTIIPAKDDGAEFQIDNNAIQSLPFSPVDVPICSSRVFLIGFEEPGVLKWSFDGQYLAVKRTIGESSPIYVIETADIDNWSNPHQPQVVAELEGDEFNWSPAANQLVFVRQNTLYLALVDSPETTAIADYLPPNTIPHFLFDGAEIAFSADGEEGWGTYGVDLESSLHRRITSNMENWQWSPSAEQFVYTHTYHEHDDTEIAVRDIDGEDSRLLTDNSACDVGPVWSPDGEKIAFVSDRNSYEDAWRDDLDIFIAGLDGRPEEQITSGETINAQPSWSPDSEQLVYVNFNYPGKPPDERPSIVEGSYFGEQDLYKYYVNKSRVVRLTTTPDEAEWLPTWSPDGNYIAYFSFYISDGFVGDKANWAIKIIRADGRSQPYLVNILSDH